MAAETGHDLLHETLEGWAARWKDGKTGWHKDAVDPMLIKYFTKVEEHFGQESGRKLRVLVPLCGKTRDLLWLSEKGCGVVGVEFAEQAVLEFFSDCKLPYDRKKVGNFTQYKCTDDKLNIEVWQGDMFDCRSDVMGQFDAVWDVASIVAINPSDRRKYVDLILALLKPDGIVLMSSFDYDQRERNRQPYSVPEPLIKELFGEDCCSFELLETVDMKKARPEKFEEFKLSHWHMLITLIKVLPK